ncbi:MAG TPA: alpha/beta fold hydrolase [Candidatus Brocadiia bacterium]|nr:alpha/beta fold hydrolase [Candidatus Brocadiia bacterium]
MRKAMLLTILMLMAARIVADGGPNEAKPYPRISEEAFKARLPFFDYDKGIPLEGRVVRDWRRDDELRQKFVFRGAQGFLVPGYIEFPNKASRPCPLVLLLHGWSGSKEMWFDGRENHGNEMRDALLGAGFAVMGLDAATHGERANEIDYQHVNPFDDPKAPTRRNYFTISEIVVQTVKDYRRSLDYMAERGDVDMGRIGLVGYSMGGMDAFYLLPVEPRIKTAVACVPPLYSGGYGPVSPIDYTWGARGKSLLMLMGLKDEMYDAGKVNASYAQYIESKESKIIWYDRGHDLKSDYVPDALEWIKTKL